MTFYDTGTNFLRLLCGLLLAAVQTAAGLLTQPPIMDRVGSDPIQPSPRTAISVPTPKVRVEPRSTPRPRTQTSGSWRLDGNVSWYGPGFYGRRTACGKAYTKQILGVAHRTLPCGTLVEFKYEGRTRTVPVIDRGPYVAGRTWDLSGGLCTYLRHCFTGPIYWRIIK